jgi:hypothetical protein
VTLLTGACTQKPNPGTTLSFQGSPFSTTAALNITTPTPAGLPYYDGTSSGLSLGAKIGISVGCILFVLATAGFCIVCNGKRRRRRVLAEKARQSRYEWDAAQHDHMANGGGGSSNGDGTPAGFFDSPQSQRPFANAWGYPQDLKSAMTESPITPVVRQGSRLADLSRDRRGPPEDGGGDRITTVGAGGISHPPPMLQPSSMR